MYKLGYSWQWFKFNNIDELTDIIKNLKIIDSTLAKSFAISVENIFPIWTCHYDDNFPSCLCYSPTHHSIYFLNDMIKEHKNYLKRWDNFYSYFKDFINNKEGEDGRI